MKRCFNLTGEQPHSNKRYRRLALVSNSRHLDSLSDSDTDTLIVSCNWLLWQREVAKGRNCVHFESFLDGLDPLNFGANYIIKSCDWLYNDGTDVTLFKGVSLGRKFADEVAQVLLEWYRLSRALEELICQFEPDEILYFDYQAEVNRLNSSERLAIIEEISSKLKVSVTDAREEELSAVPELPNKSHLGVTMGKITRTSWRECLKTGMIYLFEKGAAFLSQGRRALDLKRPTVLFLTTHRTAVPLLENFPGGEIFPMIPARLYPNKANLNLLIRNWFCGLLLLSEYKPRLSNEEIKTVGAITKVLNRLLMTTGTGHEGAVQRYIFNNVLKPDRLYIVAAQVKSAQFLFNKHKPDAIFTDGMLNKQINIFLELSQARNIPVSSTWHSPILQNEKFPIFGNDPRVEPLVDRSFTWGKVHENWLDNTLAKCTKVRTGKVSIAKHQPLKSGRIKREAALILQLVSPAEDVCARAAEEYAYFVHIVRILQDLGFKEIRLKLHPARFVTAYYQEIVDYFNINCSILHDGLISDHAEWADVVVGPIYTAAMQEVMAAGKPYYPFLLQPSSMEADYYQGGQVYQDLDSLRQALQEEIPPNQEETFNQFTSSRDIPDPVSCTWLALKDMLVTKAEKPIFPSTLLLDQTPNIRQVTTQEKNNER